MENLGTIVNNVELYPQKMRFDVLEDKWGNLIIATADSPHALTWDEAVSTLSQLNKMEKDNVVL